ncbi:hypothetical protein O181_112344 [Austropuccinia psidii MF-1]|uniref:Uncharacterized protein n=1 Tax=Austropuccinia psidii MF-1 TaxID=1389203 RepID=A0A9Q3PSN6_9BASI|nr:hypothetical protein [Austropuccinia psidii MF-1]
MQYGNIAQKYPRKEVSKCRKEQYHDKFDPEDPRVIHISKSDECGQDFQNNKWPNSLKRQIEELISENELPNIIYKKIDNNEEIFQMLVDGNEKINGNPFKTKPKRKKVRSSEHHELSHE